ncbi:TIGR03747 family integrating conjugative element membrane protein [Citrobacter sp. wls619]|uniref:TIGR03747 family integrating conjugative element membrane protein n=1 Tax=Citrobacter sp. wls619 TaxID=2576432 RepID=UPI0010C94AE0|nr:TIGR03747 family integrating conjugative element membrane protein [Citrobacter sp. wls619]TKV13922.1 TIGR03747 family integrating conjugative element membrane protein [Citrobacter sp. wls619]
MSDSTAQHQSQNTVPKKGLIATPLSWIGKICTTLFASLLFGLVVEWLGITFFWPEQGAEHSHMMLNMELGWFAENVRHSILMDDPVGRLSTLLSQIWRWLFVETRFMSWLGQLRHKPAGHWIYYVTPYAQAAVYIVMTFMLRLFILLLTSPLFMLAVLIGITDGLVRRDVRRFGSGYESGFIYHHAKRSVMPAFFLTWIIYLSLPFSVNPCVILLPAALLSGLVISIATGAFKKYL